MDIVNNKIDKAVDEIERGLRMDYVALTVESKEFLKKKLHKLVQECISDYDGAEDTYSKKFMDT